MRADRMAEVELVDVTDRGGAGGAEDAAGEAAARRARLVRVRRWWPVPVAVVVGLTAWQALDGSRAEALAERLRATPGVIDETITAPLEATTWGGPGAAEVLEEGIRAQDGLWVGAVQPDPGEPTEVVGLDPGSGTEVWRLAVAGPPSESGHAVVPACSSGEQPARLLWCTVADAGAPDAVGAEPTRLVRVDLADRSVRQSEPLPLGSVALAVGSSVVVATTGTGSVELVATDARTGELRWRSAVPDPAGSAGGSGPVLQAVGGHLLVGGLTRTWSLDPASGDLEASGPALFVVRGDQLVDVQGSSRTRLLGADGTGTAEAEGQALQMVPDDGSAGDLVLVRVLDGSPLGLLRAVDGRTGAVVWERGGSGSVATNHLLLDGVLYGSTSTEVWAVDVATGERTWSTPGEPGDAGRLMTDGTALLRTERVRDTGDRVLAAYALGDGRRAWTTPLPDGVDLVWTQAGGLYGRSGDQVVVLR
ncbi:outer membrane protein assembly factor BamB family protein [Cellulomonas sp. Marseille-Q8402]